MEVIIMEALELAVAVGLLFLLIYFVMLGINNFLWSSKGISTDKESLQYKNRKRQLKILALVVATAMYLFGQSQSM